MNRREAFNHIYELLKKGYSLDEIAQDFNIPLTSFINTLQEENFLCVPSRHKKHLNDVRSIFFIIEARAKGVSLDFLSEKFGCTKRTISDFIVEAGLNSLIQARKKTYCQSVIKNLEKMFNEE